LCRLEILRLLLQEEREHPDYIEVEVVHLRLDPDYQDLPAQLDAMDRNASSPLEYWSQDEERVCLRDIDEAASRINQFLDKESDPFS
jgi:hypothetical protein